MVNLFPGDLPPGFAMEFVPQVITPTIGGAPVSVVITTSRTLAEGNYTLPILAIGAGTTHTLEMPAQILAPDFGIEPKPTPVLLRRGGTAVVQISTHALRGMTEPIHLSLEGAPWGSSIASTRRTSRRASPAAWSSATQRCCSRETTRRRYAASLSLGVRTAALPISVTSMRATLSAAADQGCAARMPERGDQRRIRGNQAWTFPITGSTAGYTTAQAFSGTRSARFGLLPGMAAAAAQPDGPARIETNLLGEAGVLGATYSSGYQTVSIPADATSANPALLVQARRGRDE